AVRVAAYTEQSPGFIENTRLGLDDINEMSTQGIRALATWRVTDDLTLDLSALHQSQDVEDTDYWYPDVGVNRTDNYVRLPYVTDLGLYNGTLRWAPGEVEVEASISAYDWDATRYIDGTRAALDVIGPATHCALYFSIATPCDATQAEAYRDYVRGALPVVGIQPMSVDTRTGELRVSSNDRGRVDWTIGAFREDRTDRSLSTAVSANPDTGLAIEPYLVRFARTTSMEITHEALFGEFTYRPIESVALTLGARRYWYEKETSAQVLQTSYLVGTVAGDLSVVDSADEGWVHRANISYTPSDAFMLYAQYAEGFRPGGANTTPSLPDEYRTYASDAVRSVEIGMRGSWFDGRVDLSGAIYRVDWDAMQMAVKIPNFRFVANIGASVIEGLEAEIEARVTDRWTLRAGLGANNGRLTQDQTIGEIAGSGEAGDRIPLEPELMAYAGMRYDWIGPLNLDGALNIDVVYTGESNSEFDVQGDYFERMGNITTVDAQASLSNANWRASLWVSNLFDVVAESMVGSGVNSEQFTLGVRPRTLGLTFTRSF
ncbi:MAG TPA: TonB-dependent receptor, partial [Verrucomicrobiae bacterium]|nr:TonB-dependent receptor [Verrucomicrobiae bacterium]